VNQEFQRVSMHGVRVELLENQAKSIGLPLEIMQIRNAKHVYESRLHTGKKKNQGVTHSILEILTSKTYVNTGKTN
jgi:diphthamide synthase (EF-2-diphthine--ammonia ligase)